MIYSYSKHNFLGTFFLGQTYMKRRLVINCSFLKKLFTKVES